MEKFVHQKNELNQLICDDSATICIWHFLTGFWPFCAIFQKFLINCGFKNVELSNLARSSCCIYLHESRKSCSKASISNTKIDCYLFLLNLLAASHCYLTKAEENPLWKSCAWKYLSCHRRKTSIKSALCKLEKNAVQMSPGFAYCTAKTHWPITY